MSKQIIILLLLLLMIGMVLAVPEDDLDEDGILNSVDKCENTPKGATIVNPVDNIDYAGCTCDQIKEMIDTDNICIKFFCFEDKLQIEMDSYNGNFTDCPDDACVGYTYYDFPDDGYASCKNLELIEHSCEPTITENSPYCGADPNATYEEPDPVPFDIPEDKVFDEIPTLDDAKDYYLTDAVLSISAPTEITLGDSASIRSIMTFFGSGRKIVDLELFLKEQLIDTNMTFCGEDTNGTVFCYAQWSLDGTKPGKKEYELSVSYSTADGVVNERLKLPLEITTIIDKALERSNPLIGESGLTPIEEELLEMIFTEIKKKGMMEDLDMDSIKKSIRRATDFSRIDKKRTINPDSTTTYSLSIEPEKRTTLYNVTIIEAIPKAVAEHVEEIRFSIPPTEIIKDDPLIMWHFAAVDERVDLTYTINKPVQDSTGSVIMADSVEQRPIPWSAIAIMIIIPIFILGLVASRLKGKRGRS